MMILRLFVLIFHESVGDDIEITVADTDLFRASIKNAFPDGNIPPIRVAPKNGLSSIERLRRVAHISDSLEIQFATGSVRILTTFA